MERSRFLGVIYKIPCNSCDASYIGETGNFKRRIQQHQSDVRKGNASYNAFTDHQMTTNHIVDWDAASIIVTEKRLSSRLHLEALRNKTNRNVINQTRGNLPEIYMCNMHHLTQIIALSCTNLHCEQRSNLEASLYFIFLLNLRRVPV